MDVPFFRTRPASFIVVGVVVVVIVFVLVRSPSDADLRGSSGSAVILKQNPNDNVPPAPLPLYSKLTDGLHVLPFDQRLAEALGMSVRDALSCQATSSAGTSGWSILQWKAAVESASAYRAARARIVEDLSKTPLDAASDWYDQMPLMHSCGGRDPDSRRHDAALMRYGGNGDGGKWLCSAELQGSCVIYSLGSYGDIAFEEALSESSPCEIYTFDCTVPPERMPASFPPRVHFENVCVGPDRSDGSFQSLQTIAKRLGHAKLQLLKMDIEGFEFGVVASMAEAYKQDPRASYNFLPLQLSMEFHLHNTVAVARERAVVFVNAFQDLLDIGYVPVSREFNLRCMHCEEYVFVRLAHECFAAAGR